MADSNITKKALANSLKELMQQEPFEKIQVAQICEGCGMNRKSFYYHFKDKYDLLNWIFDVEVLELAQKVLESNQIDQHVDAIQEFCDYFYENRNFYRKALKIEGQNSFKEHFREYCIPIIKSRLSYLFGGIQIDDFTINFFADACVCAIERWLLDEDCMSSEEFVKKIIDLIFNGVEVLHKEITKQ